MSHGPIADLSMLEEHAEAVLASLAQGRVAWVKGPAGSGRTTLAKRLVEMGARTQSVELQDLSEADAVIHGLFQAVAGIEDASVRRPLIRDHDDLERSAAEVADALSEHDRVLVVRVPSGWCARRDATDETEHAQFERSTALLRGWIAQLARGLKLVFLTGSSPTPREAGLPYDSFDVHVLPEPVARTGALREAGRWESEPYVDGARRLAEALAARPAGAIPPTTLRLAVGLVALGADPRGVAEQLAEPGSRAAVVERLSARLAGVLGDTPAIEAAVRALVLARTVLPRSDVESLMATSPEHVPLLTQCVGYGGDEVRVSDGIRRKLARFLHAHEPAKSDEAHAALARLYAARDGAASLADAPPNGVVPWLERTHHLARSNDVEGWRALQLPARELFWDRGYYLSRVKRDYPAAVAVYRECVKRFPDDDYAHHYIGFNLERAGLERARAEAAYRKALTCGGARGSANPWWNSRLVTFLIRQGRLYEASREWDAALGRVDPEGERGEVDRWLVEHFHYWVAAAWFEAGETARARDVLALVSDELIRASDSLSALRHLVLDALEAEELGDAVYPTSVAFEERWTPEPRALPRTTEHGSDLERWYPGRIRRVDGGNVEIVYGLRPVVESEPRLALRALPREQWAAIAPDLSPTVDCFIEIGVYGGKKERVVVAPEGDRPTQLPRRGKEIVDPVLAYLKRW